MTIRARLFLYFKRSMLVMATLVLVTVASLVQTRVLDVQATVNVLVVSETAIEFGTVFPDEVLKETYTVKLDKSGKTAKYQTTLVPIPGLQDLCPFLEIKSADHPLEPDTLSQATLGDYHDKIDKWKVRLTVPGIKGQVDQAHDGGLIVHGGDFGCKIIITTQHRGKIIIKKETDKRDNNGTFNFTGTLGNFNIQTSHGDGEKTFADLASGDYTINEIMPDGWKLDNLYCKGGGYHSTQIHDKTVKITLSGDQTITCTYENEKIVKKGKVHGAYDYCKDKFDDYYHRW